jgi:uncharacterized repeat protein (TIGR04076 family)
MGRRSFPWERVWVSVPCVAVCRVESVTGQCSSGHQPGVEIVVDGETVHGRICLHTLYSMLPKVVAMRYGAQFSWHEGEHSHCPTHVGPDAQNPVVFEARRICGA